MLKSSPTLAGCGKKTKTPLRIDLMLGSSMIQCDAGAKPSAGLRLCILAVITWVMMTTAEADQSPQADDWPWANLTEAGFAADLGNRLDAAVHDRRLHNLHAVVVVHGGKLVLERYWTGEDEIWGTWRGWVKFGPRDLHDIRSVKKSVVGLLYGIALNDRVVPPLNASLIDQFPADGS
jgi:hypothetical protein